MSDNAPANDTPRGLAVISLKGFCMGAADVVPGVSGGTMAFILGIYQRLLETIKAFDLTFARLALTGKVRAAWSHVDATFALALGIGVVSAIAFFTRVVPLPKLVRSDPEIIYGLFFGLIVGSVVVLVLALERLRGGDYLYLIAGIGIGFAIVNLVPLETPDATWFIALSGALAISAMILPGISGSFILLIMQKYAYVLDGIGRLDLAIIIPFGAGCAVGLMVFSRFLTWLLARWYRATLVTIIGLLIGSLWRIWPFQDRVFVEVRGKSRLIDSTPILPGALDSITVTSIGLGFAGLIIVAVVYGLSRMKAARI